jgi:hypothetical protein
MPESSTDLAHWQAVPLPAPVRLAGHWVTLEPLSAERHATALWHAVEGHDAVWDWQQLWR